ncbi:MAG: alpha/beta fold hydrolase [Gemmatimonadetes bacterium]|nr:alpha/beta fold hydrolase [Gemmatimonadota bacterium]
MTSLRRNCLRLLAALVLLCTQGTGAAAQEDAPAGKTFVVVHGAWGGGWAWKRVDSLLTPRGHTVYRPTLTGLGERVHLGSPEVGLGTHVRDVVNTLVYEDLRGVVLVGHSYGGMVITGVADQVPDRISHLVYLDAYLPEHGESVLGLNAPLRDSTILGWTRFGMIVPPWLEPHRDPPWDVPHPYRSFTDPLLLAHPPGRGLRATYVLTMEPGKQTDPFSLHADRALARGWTVLQMTAGHNPQTTAPRELADLFHELR